MQRSKQAALGRLFSPRRQTVGGQGQAQSDRSRPGGGAALCRQSLLLLAVHGLFVTANALSGTFVHVYLWKVRGDFALVGWFACASHAAMALTFWFAGKWVKEHDKMVTLRLGTGMAAVFYLAVLLLKKQAVHYVWPLGILQGMSSGFFWLAFNVAYFEVTNPDNRDRFNGWAGLIGSGGGMLAPWLSGFLISRMGGGKGYTLIFSLSLIVFVVGVVVSFFLKKRKNEGEYSWFYAVGQLRDKKSPWRRAVTALVFQGVREGVFVFLIGLLVYAATRNEMKLGNFSLITSGVAFFTFLLTGKYLKPKRRSTGMLIGTLMLIVVALPLLRGSSYISLLVLGVGSACFLPLYTVPMTSSVFDLIGLDEESASHREEYIVLRELGMCIGRIAGTLLYIAVVSSTTSPLATHLLVLGIASAPFFSWLFMRKLLAVRTNHA